MTDHLPGDRVNSVDHDNEKALLRRRISELEAALLASRQQERGLLEDGIRFRQFTEIIDDVFLLTTRDHGEVLYVSPSYETVWQKPCSSLYEEPLSRLESVVEEDRVRLLSTMGSESTDTLEMEYRISLPTGEEKWLRERRVPVCGDTGEVYRCACIIKDITEQKRLILESDRRLQQIVQADRLASLGEVVAGVAHEINNPNSFITYNVPLLEETWNIFEPLVKGNEQHPASSQNDLDLEEYMQDMREIIEAIKVGSERINRVVSNLKDFARLDESSHTREVEINEVINKTLTIVGAHLRKSAEKISLYLAEDLPSIQGHAQKLEQVVANLLVNASHAVDGARPGKIDVRTRYVKNLDAILIEIEDNGRGIPSDRLSRVMEPFYTTRRTEGGTGLGLSVSYGLVKEHGGRIGVKSKVGTGSRFTVFLPVHRDRPVEIKPTILCVDDDPRVLKLVQSILLNVEDAFVETTADPEGIVDYLQCHPEVDVVLSDVIMDKLNGWDLMERIKHMDPLISVILYSGHPGALSSPRTMEFKPDATLEKPFPKIDLINTIHAVGRQKL